MKKLIIIAIALFTLQISAQERGERRGRQANLTPEETAELQTKKMTLDLDLTDAQQAQVKKINLENAKARQAKMEAFKSRKDNKDAERPSKEERLKMKNEMLDAQIENKRQMKSILNAEQYEKWEKSQGKRKEGMRGKRKMQDSETRKQHRG